MINILQKIMKILHEKILKVINLYWFHNDAREKNNLLNGHSNKLRINEYRFAISPVKWNCVVEMFESFWLTLKI